MNRRFLRKCLLLLPAAALTTAQAQFGPAPSTQSGVQRVQPPVAAGSEFSQSLQGSVPSGQATATPIDLSLRDAISRGLKFNLGILTSSRSEENVRAQRLRVLSGLLPNVTGNYTQTIQQVNLEAQGLRFNAPPGSPISIPKIVGPFGNVDTRASLSQTVVDLTQWKNLHSADASIRAAQLNIKDTQDLVVQAVANSYLLIIADVARVETAQATVNTSQALFQRAVDQKSAGTVAAIDQLRAEVQLKTDQQSLLAAQNQLEKDKLALGRVIGLPPGQQFNIADRLPFAPLEAMTPDAAMTQAFANRSDYRAAQQQVKAAELARSAARAEYLPTVHLDANYGDSGVNVGHSHGVFQVSGELRFNIFDGGRIKSDVEQADVTVKQRQDALGDLRGRIDYEIRAALLDLHNAADQVAVAERNVQLASETLIQARDRFSAGVTDNIEVVQAQQSVVTANTNYINATYQHNIAKVELARSLGLAEENLHKFLGGK